MDNNNNNNSKLSILLYGDYYKENYHRCFGDDTDDDREIKLDFRIKNILLLKNNNNNNNSESSIPIKLFIRDINEYTDDYKYFKDGFYKTCQGFILVYNVNDHERSFNNIKRWLQDIKRAKCSNYLYYLWNYYNDNIIHQLSNILIVSSDSQSINNSPENRNNNDIVKQYAHSISIPFIEVSNEKCSIYNAYYSIANTMYDNLNKN